MTLTSMALDFCPLYQFQKYLSSSNCFYFSTYKRKTPKHTFRYLCGMTVLTDSGVYTWSSPMELNRTVWIFLKQRTWSDITMTCCIVDITCHCTNFLGCLFIGAWDRWNLQWHWQLSSVIHRQFFQLFVYDWGLHHWGLLLISGEHPPAFHSLFCFILFH